MKPLHSRYAGLKWSDIARADVPPLRVLVITLFIAGYWLPSILIDAWWLIGVLFFAAPFLLWTFGRGRLGAVHPRQVRLEFWMLLLVINLPFWLVVLGGSISGAAVIWFTIMVVVAGMYSGFKRGLARIPGVDVALTGLLLAAPFMFGVLLRSPEGVGWLPAWITIVLWIMAGYVMYKITRINADIQQDMPTMVTKIGVEKSLAVALGLSTVTVILPTFYYGWHGVAPSLLLVPFAILIFKALPAREHAGSSLHFRTWQAIKRYAYVSGIAIVLYLVSLAIFGW